MASAEAARPVPLAGPTATSSVLVAAACLAALLDAWSSWFRHGVTADYVASAPGVGVADLTSASATGRTADALYVFAVIAAVVAVLVWLARVRANTRGQVPRRLPRTLAAGGWLATAAAGVALTLFHDLDATVDHLSQLARLDSALATAQCLAGAALVVVIRRTTNRITTETNQPGRTMRG
ncbi:hypothetical protein [Actinophytocola xinjiangensis]|uniref:hypothetical protein n=1 Tax=Actinophytocola xinjiangensis TaxID=485602 RepID=UPI000A5A1CF9|nr:hypothetical protein [Actinophytocola xinjiangensis]